MSHTTHPYQKELEVATLAVKRASLLTKQLSDSIVQTAKSGTLTKDDKSPVTIGDFALQAIINHAIKLNFLMMKLWVKKIHRSYRKIAI